MSVPLLIRISSSRSGSRAETVLWDRPTLIIGRSEECDLRLPHSEVARQHALLQFVDGGIFCADLDSGTGTHWRQGENSRQQGPLEFGEPVSIGPYSLTIEPAPQFGPLIEGSADDEGSAPAAPDGLFLDFRDGSNGARRWPATRPVTLIGSGNCCKVTLVHASVSKCHCAIVRAGQALWVVDLLSEEGTVVNGDLKSTARLESGDLVRIGRFSVATHYGSPLDDESISFSSSDGNMPALPNASAGLNQMQQQALAAAQQAGGKGEGVSEQFVLDVINQLGVMQQQALQHAQQSMTQALQAVTVTYQDRIATLEKQYESLKKQLTGLPGPETDGLEPQRPGLPEYSSAMDPLAPLPPNMVEPEFHELPDPDHGSFECDDPEVREQWLREKMKLVEAELDKTRKGWGKRLIDLIGY